MVIAGINWLGTMYKRTDIINVSLTIVRLLAEISHYQGKQ